MNKITLVIMAAGLGSRYGSLKQMEKVGPNNESILEYSIYDGIKSGITKVIFIIRKAMYKSFRENIGKKIENIIETEYVFQEINKDIGYYFGRDLREKPLGTGHAILCCKDKIKEPFIVINADDFYGRSSYEILCEKINKNRDPLKYFMVGFKLSKTLTDFGSISRGICEIDSKNNLISLCEKTKIIKENNLIFYEEDGEKFPLKEDTLVSMNIWALNPSIFERLEKEFLLFLKEEKKDYLKAEFYLPKVINTLIKNKEISVELLKTKENWYGITYKEDKVKINKALRNLSGKVYPNNLWEEFK